MNKHRNGNKEQRPRPAILRPNLLTNEEREELLAAQAVVENAGGVARSAQAAAMMALEEYRTLVRRFLQAHRLPVTHQINPETGEIFPPSAPPPPGGQGGQ